MPEAYGQIGVRDLGAKVLDTPVDPEVSFSDDPLRMVRAARFVSTLGVVPREIATAPLTGNSAAKFDPVKLAWIGTPTTETTESAAPPRAHH